MHGVAVYSELVLGFMKDLCKLACMVQVPGRFQMVGCLVLTWLLPCCDEKAIYLAGNMMSPGCLESGTGVCEAMGKKL
jgi:hypothetical protein